ncbi:hypothetical protein ACFYO7_07420 [Nocardia salmonicida]|uniref:hypothetical protein n=1 Tax=Nocardia salmonicida TaxID=53431 RepID=UPI00369D2647
MITSEGRQTMHPFMPHNAPGEPNSPEQPGTVIAQLPQGYDVRVKFNFVLGSGLLAELARCRPRQGAVPEWGATTLPEPLRDKLKAADQLVLDWLAQDRSHPKLFLVKPVDAMLKAGVELSRREQRMLERLHAAASETNTLPPGTSIARLSIAGIPDRCRQQKG